MDFIRGHHKSLAYLSNLHTRYGETVSLPLKIPTFLLFSPTDIRQVLVTNPANYLKTGGLVFGSDLFGKGLLSSEGSHHGSTRRLIQPMFHSGRISALAATMTTTVLEMISQWNEGTVIDVPSQMMQMTLRIVGRALFGVDLVDHLDTLGESVIISQKYITDRIWQPFRYPGDGKRRRESLYHGAIAALDAQIYGMIASRRQASSKPDDLLTMLTESRYEDGTSMSDRQIRDEIATFIAAGHETTANALTWVWYLLSKHPDVEARMVEELRCRIGGRLPNAADLSSLTYTEMVVAEAMRLYPPVWLIARKVVAEETLPGGTLLPAGSQVVIIPYVTHRNPRFFPDPDSFRPERFSGGSRHELQVVYLPFSAGPRGCIGEPFAKMESVLLLATIAQRWRLTLGKAVAVEPELLQTLRPRSGIPMRLEMRR